MTGLGVDVVEIEHLRKSLDRSVALRDSLFTPNERAYCERWGDPVVHLAGLLAAKEAVVKALGSGSVPQVEITHAENGAPVANFDATAIEGLRLSISHDGPIAVAVALMLD